MPPPFNDMSRLPAVPPGVPCCLWHVHRIAQGQRQMTMDVPSYPCPMGQTETGTVILNLPLSFPTPPEGGHICNETDAIPEGALLVTSGPIIRRADFFAIYSASVDITDANGTPLFSGWIELYDRVGTHPNEPCDPWEHIEGWLVAQEVGNQQRQALHLEIMGHTVNPRGPGPIDLVLNGALVLHP